jgi:K+-transporting ATPase ATPase A chain
MRWTQYALAVLAFNLLSALVVYGLQRLQIGLTQSAGLLRRSPDSSFNTAAASHQYQLAGLWRRAP